MSEKKRDTANAHQDSTATFEVEADNKETAVAAAWRKIDEGEEGREG